MAIDLGTLYREQEKLKLTAAKQKQRKEQLREIEELTKSERWIEAKSAELVDMIKTDIASDRLQPEYRINHTPHDPYAQMYIDNVRDKLRNNGFKGFQVDHAPSSKKEDCAVHIKLYAKL